MDGVNEVAKVGVSNVQERMQRRIRRRSRFTFININGILSLMLKLKV
jgi:hypothetical protein